MRICRVCGRRKHLADYEETAGGYKSQCVDCQDRQSGSIKESVRIQNEIDEIVRNLDSSMDRLSKLTNFERVNEICVWLFERNLAKRVLSPPSNRSPYGPRK